MAFPRRTLLGASLAAATMAAVGCSAADSSGSPKISFLYSPYADYAPFFLAQDKGYFSQAGVEVELLAKGGTSGETYQLVSTNNVTSGGATWGAGLFNANAAGASLSVIASVSRIPLSGPNPAPFLVSTSSGITSVADLAGRRVGTPGDGGFGIYSIAKALESGGLTLADVELVNVGPPETGPALSGGSIDAAWSIEPISTALTSQGIAEELLPIDYHAGTELGALVFSSDFVDENPEAVVNFTAAYLAAAAELKAGGWDDPDNQQIIATYTELPVETLTSLALTEQDPTGTIDWDDVHLQETFFRERGTLEFEGQSDIENAFRSDLLEQARQRSAELGA
ncbi:ABC transporter substrate-binding protein [Parenemella sanctibonifatiensis]|uniref:Nitrate ABC transporter substrate-binding protein n=1 Tax=Parenemella sanctibonifatiensis TaxID=2016505 RepID=A0A255E9K0_9ACTN|nr:ABC transporter substrate-binding protein [Parenemella sanctibonifatiensis]OYN87950.1 nitrate ABC transporter substrate-binding protein [Parenemella sanctibonifatiensis]